MPSTKITDSNFRLNEYLRAINFYLNIVKCSIVFVENTGVDLSNFVMYLNKNENRIEFITFKGNNFNKKLGKGFGEGKIIEYAFNESKIIANNPNKLIVKISGRHIVKNINHILYIDSILNNTEHASAHINIKSKAAVSDLFIASHYFYQNYLIH